MVETMKVSHDRDVLSLVPGVVFASVPGWFRATWDQLKMDVIMPKAWKGHKALPCLVWICGGGFLDVDASVWVPEMVRIAEAGFVVASVEYRTSGQAQFPAQLEDVKAAVRFLRAHAERYCIDPGYIFAMGESAGGCLASLLGVTGDRKEFDVGENLNESSAVQGVVDVYGLVDISTEPVGPETGLPYWLMEAFVGTGFTKKQADAASAVSYVSSVTPPFLIIQGTGDTVVDPGQSQAMYDALCAHGVPAHLIYVEGAYHGDELIYQNAVINKTIDFLKKLAEEKVCL